MSTRREVIGLLGGAAAWPATAGAQQAALPVIGFLRSESLADVPERITAFHRGMKEAGYVEGQNVAIEYSSAEGQIERLPALVADLLRRSVVVIVGNTPSARAAKAATTTVPIIFTTGGDPVKDGLVTSLNRPGGNVTGVSFIAVELGAKQLGLLRELRPAAARIAVLVDPRWPLTESFVSRVRTAALAVEQQIEFLYAGTGPEIETAVTTFVQRGGGVVDRVGNRCGAISGKFRVADQAARSIG